MAVPTIAAADTYTQATFSGGVFPGNANVQPPFAGNGFNQGDPISGSFVFDNDLVPPAGSGFFNVYASSFPDVSNIPNANLFSVSLDTLSFDAGGNLNSQLPSTGAQYNNGQFNGLEFITDFAFQGNSYQFRIDGPNVSVLPVDSFGNPTSFQPLISGYINLGNSSLTNETAFTPVAAPPPPGAPEPTSWALLLLGVFATGSALRGRRHRAVAA
ncbi:MAG TPA: PEP-CTERM sorting domain-containing protein [Caulobacteraceae bacterium]